jgi:hypothetical protein
LCKLNAYLTPSITPLYSTPHSHRPIQDEEAAEKLDIGGGSNKDKANMSAKEIDELLKRGAYDVFREDDSDQQEFEEADIDSILERRARKVTSCDLLRGCKLYCTVQYYTAQS